MENGDIVFASFVSPWLLVNLTSFHKIIGSIE